jgi:hypothetical protein
MQGADVKQESAPEEWVSELLRWLHSPEGQAQIQTGQEAARREIERLREARRIDPETLRRPMTI